MRGQWNLTVQLPQAESVSDFAMPFRPGPLLRPATVLFGFCAVVGLVAMGGCSKSAPQAGSAPSPAAASAAAPIAPAATAVPAAPTPEAVFAKDIKPFITANCFECHDTAVAEGGLKLDTPALGAVASMRTHRDTWERVLTKVSRDIMPPHDAARQPTAAERAAMVASLEKVLHPIDPAKPDAGRVVLRRLNREEYKNTVQDILGVSFNPAADFPADDSGYGYDNIGDVLTLSPLLFERYLAAAKAIARDVVPERLPPSRVIYGSADVWKGEGMEFLPPAVKLPRSMRVSWSFSVPATGTYKLAASAGSGDGATGPSGNLRYNLEIDGVVVAKDLETQTGSRDTGFPQSGPTVKITKGAHVMTFDYYSPQPPLPTVVATAPTDPAAPPARGARGGRGGRGGGGAAGGNLWIHMVTIEGPSSPEPLEPNAAFARLVGEPKSGESRDAWIARGVTTLATPLLRRAPTADEAAQLVAMVKAAIAAGGTPEAGWQTALQAVLVSPSFLFRGELPGKGETADKNYALGEPELATRLAYFLWSSAPDEQLRNLAAQGKLRASLNAEIKRLLADPRADRFVRNFAGQWLHLRNLPQRETDPRLYPNWSPAIVADMAVETQKFFADFLTNGQPVTKMLTADYSFISPLLAKFYGINLSPAPSPVVAATPPPSADPVPATVVPMPDGGVAVAPTDPNAPPARGARGAGRGGRGAAGAAGVAAGRGRGGAAAAPVPSKPEEFIRTTLPAERQAGLLGQASILALSSYANRTSPVLRGKFILESILGSAPPPAPANVPGLPETVGDSQPATVRERLALHRQKPECNICHKDIDPIGFALENFDATGAWRTAENGMPVDSVGELPSGEKVSGAVELGRLLAGPRRVEFEKNLAAQLLTYAIGRGTDYYDRPAIEQIVAAAEKNGATLPAYIEAVANSLAFQQRRGEPELGPATAAPVNKVAQR
jgi:hypothetical protein